MDMFIFLDRTEAGEKLAAVLREEPLVKEAAAAELLVLSIPRGGVIIGAEVAKALGCAHQVIVVKKIGFPGHKELAIGAMAEDGLVVLNRELSKYSRSEDDYLTQEQRRLKAKIEAYIQKFRQGRPLDIHDKTVIVVDDGIATGETMKAAVLWLTSQEEPQRPKKVIVAVPVCSPRTAIEFEELVDRFISLSTPEHFWAVGQFYWNFDPVYDHEVVKYLSPDQELSSSGEAA